jgi:glycosyltransferase involved in cell wall biosynthesis
MDTGAFRGNRFLGCCSESMMHLFINALAASAGGGLTYIRNVLPHLSGQPELKVTIAVTPGLRQEFRSLASVEFMELGGPIARRFWFEQSALPESVRDCGADVLLSTGNFALRRSPVPQILLSRNSIYLSRHFYSDLLSRGEYRTWIDTHIRSGLAKRSIHWADITVAPSRAFASELQRWSGRPVQAIYHGFDHHAFTRNTDPLSPEVEGKLRASNADVTLLFVSHYNYYRNFETLIKAIPLLRSRLAGRSCRLLLTCQLEPGKNPGTYNPRKAAELIQKLGVRDLIVELGAIPYDQLHNLYDRADLYVTPAYTETFAHPLVEAMASGVPIIASDLEVHREICGDAAIYFPTFSPEKLAESIGQLVLNPRTAKQMSIRGMKRSQDFSWKQHVQEILKICETLLKRTSTRWDSAVQGLTK